MNSSVTAVVEVGWGRGAAGTTGQDAMEEDRPFFHPSPSPRHHRSVPGPARQLQVQDGNGGLGGNLWPTQVSDSRGSARLRQLLPLPQQKAPMFLPSSYLPRLGIW